MSNVFERLDVSGANDAICDLLARPGILMPGSLGREVQKPGEQFNSIPGETLKS